MSNKPNLDRLKVEHERSQRELYEYWLAHYRQSPQVDMKRTSSLVLVGVAQRWERFRSDWQIRAIARDSSTYSATFLESIENSLEKSFKAGVTSGLLTVRTSLPKHLSISEVELLLDASERNVTYGSRKHEEVAARRQLAPEYRDRVFRRTDDDWLVLDLVRKVRNAISHGSGSSMHAMNAAAAAMSTSSLVLDRALAKGAINITESGIGAYLYASLPGFSPARIAHLIGRVIEVADSL